MRQAWAVDQGGSTNQGKIVAKLPPGLCQPLLSIEAGVWKDWAQSCQKTLEYWWTINWMSQQCSLAVQKANCILCCIKDAWPAGWRRLSSPFCSALVRLHLEYCVHMWSPQDRRDMLLLECIWRRVTSDSRDGTPPLQGLAESAGAVQLGEEKAPGRPGSSL